MQGVAVSVDGESLALVGQRPAHGRAHGRAAGGQDRVRVGGPVVAPVVAPGGIQAGRDVPGARVRRGQRAAQRGLEPRIDRLPGDRQIGTAGPPGERDGGAQADGGPHVVAGDATAELLVVGDRAGRQQALGVALRGLGDPAHRGPDVGQLPGRVGGAVGQQRVLLELPQRLTDAVLLPGAADVEPVGLLPVGQEGEVLCRGRVQSHLVQGDGVHRRVPDPVGLVLQPVDALDPSRRGQVAGLQDRGDVGVVDVVDPPLGNADPGQATLLRRPVGGQLRPRPRERHRVERAIGSSGGGRRQRDLPRPGRALARGQPTPGALAGVRRGERIAAGERIAGRRHRKRPGVRRPASEQLPVAVDVATRDRIDPARVEDGPGLLEEPVARRGGGALEAIRAGAHAVQAGQLRTP